MEKIVQRIRDSDEIQLKHREVDRDRIITEIHEMRSKCMSRRKDMALHIDKDVYNRILKDSMVKIPDQSAGRTVFGIATYPHEDMEWDMMLIDRRRITKQGLIKDPQGVTIVKGVEIDDN